jgi:hypothetical protein
VGRQPVLQRQTFLRGGGRHCVHEALTRSEIPRRNRWAGQPILLVGADACGTQVAHPIGPKRGVDRHITGDSVALPIRAGGVDPAIVGDQRQAEPALEGGEPVGE